MPCLLLALPRIPSHSLIYSFYVSGRKKNLRVHVYLDGVKPDPEQYKTFPFGERSLVVIARAFPPQAH